MNLKLVLVNTGANHMTVQLTWMESTMATNNSEKTLPPESNVLHYLSNTRWGGGVHSRAMALLEHSITSIMLKCVILDDKLTIFC